MESKFDKSILKASKLVFISQNALNTFLNLNPYFNNPNKYSFFPNGIEKESNSNPISLEHLDDFFQFKYRLCSVGSFSERKGQLKIIEALKEVDPSKLSQIGILFIGEGPDFVSSKELVSRYKLSKHVFFEGIIPNDKIPSYLKKSNIFILMSSNEGLPISIIEAMRESLPIIGTSISGVTELVQDGYNGNLIEPEALELTELLNKIEHFNWIEMGKNSKTRFLEKYTFERMMENYASMILSV
jgi:glycosyltransferase involved in cell wall biosynthesis